MQAQNQTANMSLLDQVRLCAEAMGLGIIEFTKNPPEWTIR